MAKYTQNVGGMTIEFDDNSKEVLEALKNAIDRGLKACGEVAVGYAQGLVPVQSGALKASITYAVEGEECYIGTNVHYAPYVEFGTGIYAESGGRQTPWTYQDENGVFHTTRGQKAHPFLRPSASDHGSEYRSILEDSIKNA